MEKNLNSEDWKFCAVVDLGIVTKESEQLIQFNEHTIRMFKPSDKVAQGYSVAEVYSLKSKYPDNETAFHGSLDILNKVLSRISIATFRSCKVISPVGITQFRAEKKQPFIMLLTANFLIQTEAKPFSAQGNSYLFTSINQQELNDSISEISLAINSTSIYHKFSHYYNCIERIAHLSTTENVKNVCINCGEINEIAVKATGIKMRELFIKNGFENKTYRKCRSVRGKLAHGSSERTRNLNLEVLECLPVIEKVALKALEENTSIKALSSEIIPQLNDQFIEIIGSKRWNKNFLKNAAYDVVSHKVKFNVRMNVIGKNNEKEGFITDHIPLSIDPRTVKIFRYAWPY